MFLKDVGEKEGKFYAINVPLRDGIDDGSFLRLFKTVILVNFGFYAFLLSDSEFSYLSIL